MLPAEFLVVLILQLFEYEVVQNFSEHPESNQGPFDICEVYSRTLYQLSYIRYAQLELAEMQRRSIASELPLRTEGTKLSNPGFEPGLPRPQRGVLTARRIRQSHNIFHSPLKSLFAEYLLISKQGAPGFEPGTC